MLPSSLKLTLVAALLAVACAAATPRFQLRDTDGRTHTQTEWAGHKAVLLFFVISDCPVAGSYVPEMNRIAAEYASRGVVTWAVQADPSASLTATAGYAHEYRYAYPVLFDPSQMMVKAAGATVTPEVAVLSPDGRVLYRGRIDNRVENFGVQRPMPTRHDLRDALDDVLAGRVLREPFTRSIGCAITQESQN